MAKPTPIDPLSAALDRRLEELFPEEEPAAIAPRKAADGPLGELRKILLSIDWEITPETLDSFLDQVRLLRQSYHGDAGICLLLEMLRSIGRYIRSSRSRVHPATFVRLNSVFARLEEFVNTPDLPAAVRRKLLRAEVNAFQQLRAQIRQRRKPPAVAAPAAAGRKSVGAGRVGDAPVTQEMLVRAAAELKETIQREMHSIRQLLAELARR